MKTSDGWFIKTRYNYSAGGAKPVDFPRFDGRPIAPPPAASGVGPAAQDAPGRTPGTADRPRLSALDHIEIEMLYGWNNIALDSAAEGGEIVRTNVHIRRLAADRWPYGDGSTAVGRVRSQPRARDAAVAIEPLYRAVGGGCHRLGVRRKRSTDSAPRRARPRVPRFRAVGCIVTCW